MSAARTVARRLPEPVKRPLRGVVRRGRAHRAARRARPIPNSSRVHLERMVGEFAASLPAGALVLDAGAGRAPYRALFDHTRYETADFAALGMKYAPLTYVCDLADIPVDDRRFDAVVCNQVLEHVPEPQRVLDELFRVTAPGGQVFLSVPLFFGEHQVPHDYYRYTQFALTRLFERAGFEVERLQWLEGYFGTMAYQFSLMRQHLPGSVAAVRSHRPGWRVVYLAPLVLMTRWWAARLERWFGSADIRLGVPGRALPLEGLSTQGMPKNYVVHARRP